jgi:hypothetical protein
MRRNTIPVSAAIAVAAMLIGSAIAIATTPETDDLASERGDWWRGQATTALAGFLAEDTGDGDAFTYGMATGAAAQLYGWTDPRTVLMLSRLRAEKLPGGGYGLGRPYDAFADGTVNPATTQYAVTLAGHVGPTLLAGYRAGAIPRAEVQDIVARLVAFPRVAVDRGQCVAYSDSPNDNPPANPAYPIGCVHNVSVAVGWFLSEANAAGFGATGMQRLITDITLTETVAYRENDLQWPYIDQGPFLDADHDSAEAEAMYRLAYWIGREVAYRWMNGPITTGEPKGPIVHTRIAGMPGGNGSWSRTSPGVTLWCEMSDRWRDEQGTYRASQDGAALAQFAYYAARAYRSCA